MNKQLKYILLLMVAIQSAHGIAQTTAEADSSRQFPTKEAIVTGGFIGLGAALNYSTLEKNIKNDLVNRFGENLQSDMDDYLQHVPMVQLYLADALGVKSQHHWFDQTKYLIISQIISATVTEGVKKLTQKDRPNGMTLAFPSGHTTFAFTNAMVLYEEFKATAPLLAYSGFLFSSATGAYRMINNRHWFSDVVAGAGVGMLTVVLVYYWKPFEHFNPFLRNKNMSFVPIINREQVALSVRFRLR